MLRCSPVACVRSGRFVRINFDAMLRHAARWPAAASFRALCPTRRVRRLTSDSSSSSPEALARMLSSDPVKLEAFVKALPSDTKKVVGLRWAMAELEDEFAKADYNADGHLTFQEFHNWAHGTVTGTGPTNAEANVTNEQLRALAIQNIIPFIGFGCVDNSLMILSGDLIDSTIGVALGISTLAAAALGNAMSNSLGMVLHGFIERFANSIGLPDPRLTVTQRHAKSVKNVKMVSGVAGVMIGCVLGALPPCPLLSPARSSRVLSMPSRRHVPAARDHSRRGEDCKAKVGGARSRRDAVSHVSGERDRE